MNPVIHDPINVWNGEKFVFTLNKLCQIIFGNTDSLPEALRPIADKPIERVVADSMPAKSGLRVVFDLSWNLSEEESRNRFTGYLQEGIVLVSNRKFTDANGKAYPVIHVKDPWEAWITLGQYVKKVFPMPTIAITGSAGKTTTTMFAECVFNERYKSFVSGLDGRNFNTTLQIVNQWILRCDPSYTFHVQECGAETKKLIECSARVIDTDAFGITNIDTTQHIASYETAENLIADKTSFDRVRKKTTYGVINLDDEILRKHRFKSPIITFAIQNEKADYVGKNIVQNGELLEFDVVSKTEDPVHIRIHIIGKHNVYNALMVFAFAKKFGLTNEEIQRGFFKYESVGIRQYLRKVGGRLLYMDAYNASVESTQLSIKALEELIIPAGGRKIAVVGERKTSNEETLAINYGLGRSLIDYEGIDEFIIVGEDKLRATGKPEGDTVADPRYRCAVYDGARSVIKDPARLSYCTNLAELAARLRYQTRPGDAILFKGRYHLSLWAVADQAFGTAYTKVPALIPLNVKKKRVASKQASGTDYTCLDGVSLTTLTNGFDTTKLICPAMLGKRPVIRIDEEAFAGQSQLRQFVFSARIRAIGDGAFRNCTNLEHAELPKDCIYIGDGAFEGCKKLVRASMPGVNHITRNAFRNCANLKQILLTEKCATIEDEAFAGCTGLTVCAPADSYAAVWAEQHNFALEIIDADEELAKLAKNGTRLRPNVYGLKKAQPEQVAAEDGDGNVANLSVVVTGDIMVHDDQLAASLDQTTGLYHFDKLFANTAKYLKAADLAIGNVETVFGPGVYTGFPCFNTPDDLVGTLVRAGLDISASANNHIFDMKYAGILRTKRVLKDHGIEVAGIRSSEQDKAYVVVERKGVKIALINYTYRTQSIEGKKSINMRALDPASAKSVNTFCYETLGDDLEDIRDEIRCARADGADIVLVYYHWGCEYERYANTLQKYIAYKTAEMGADAIIGSHAHVLQELSSVTVNLEGREKTVPVFYGLGNYCWGSRLPRTGRETVQNGALAQLNIAYDRQSGQVLSVDTDYVPLYIKTDYVADHFDFNVLSLRDMTQEEIAEFDVRSSLTAAQIAEEIDRTVRGKIHDVTEELVFDRVLEVPLGQRINVRQELFSDREDIVMFRSENAPVASILQSGEVIPNSPGFVGMTAVTEAGVELCFVIRVTGMGKNPLPIIVNRFNSVPDIYRPGNMVTGVEYGLYGGISLELNTAKAWRAMQAHATANGVYIRCVGGYRTNEAQLKKIITHIELFGEEAAAARFMPLGYSEHHLGIAVDVANLETGPKTSTREQAFAWIEQNAHRFGFLIRPSTRILHKHLTYVGDPAAAKLLQEEGANLTRYVGLNKQYKAKLQKKNRWMTNCLTPREIAQPQSKWTKLTLNRICRLIGVDVPAGYRDIQHRIVPQVTITDLNMVPGSIFFYDKGLKNATSKCRNAIRQGAVLAITDTPVTDELGNLLPQILVEDAFDACVSVGRFLRKMHKAKVIGIEEMPERRILRNILMEVLSDGYKVHKNKRAVDNRINTLAAIQELQPEHQIYLQNIRGVSNRYIAKNVDMLAPDIAVVVPIGDEIPKGYSSVQQYEKDYMTLAQKTLASGGMAFVDSQDPLMEKFAAYEKCFTYSSKDKQADYYLHKKEVGKETVQFTVVRKKDGEKITRSLPVVFKNSPSYAVAAVAVADKLK